MHVIFNEIIPDPTAEYFAELERLKIEVAEESKDPVDFQFLVGTQHLDDDDGLVYETTRVVVQRGFLVAYRRLVTSGDNKPREEATPIHVADVARITAALRSTPGDDSVSSAIQITSGTPEARAPSVTLDPIWRTGAQVVQPQSSAVPRWNSEGRLATDTPVEKRRRLSQELALQTNLQLEFATPPRRGRRK